MLGMVLTFVVHLEVMLTLFNIPLRKSIMSWLIFLLSDVKLTGLIIRVSNHLQIKLSYSQLVVGLLGATMGLVQA